MLGDLAIRSLRERSERARSSDASRRTAASMFEQLQASLTAAISEDDSLLLTGAPPRGQPKLEERRLERALPDVCPVCLETREGGELVVTLGCQHTFHAHCARRWLETAVGCPTCRARVPRIVGEHEVSETAKDYSGLNAIMEAVRSQRHAADAEAAAATRNINRNGVGSAAAADESDYVSPAERRRVMAEAAERRARIDATTSELASELVRRSG